MELNTHLQIVIALCTVQGKACSKAELSILFKLRTWSKSCFPVVLGWIANSSSASIVVTRTFSFQNQQSFRLIDELKMNVHKYVLSNSTLTGVKLHKEGSTPNTRQKRHIAIVLTTFGIFKFSLFSPKINSQDKSVGISWPTEVKPTAVEIKRAHI